MWSFLSLLAEQASFSRNPLLAMEVFNLKRMLLLKQLPVFPNLGLLALRVLVFLPLLVKHGALKLSNFGQMAHDFPDPLHIGSLATLALATFSDAICSVLIIAGLATRWAALFVLCNLLVAFIFVHHLDLMSWKDMGGQIIFMFMGGCIAVLLLGPGKYSVDALIEGAGKE
jgi:putative oxidoreductase